MTVLSWQAGASEQGCVSDPDDSIHGRGAALCTLLAKDKYVFIIRMIIPVDHQGSGNKLMDRTTAVVEVD